MLCIDRLLTVLKDWQERHNGRLDFEQKDHQTIILVEDMIGTGRFTFVIEIIAPTTIVISTHLWDELKGSVQQLECAWRHLLELNDAMETVMIKRNEKTGALGASVTFSCDRNKQTLENQLYYHLTEFNNALEAYFNSTMELFCEWGLK